MKRIALICVRSGSKGVPGKNIKKISGIPLLVHSLRQAQDSKLFGGIAVSSDGEDVLAVAKKYGCNMLIRRPKRLAGDRTPKIPVIRHALTEAESLSGFSAETVVDLDATSPLRNVQDIKNCVQLLETKQHSVVITACHSRRSPYFNLIEKKHNGGYAPVKKKRGGVFRRQDSPLCYDMNASIYVWQRKYLMMNDSVFGSKTGLYIMPEERSFDIDTPFDFEIVSALMRKKVKK